jgi:hypothetical protein
MQVAVFGRPRSEAFAVKLRDSRIEVAFAEFAIDNRLAYLFNTDKLHRMIFQAVMPTRFSLFSQNIDSIKS